MFDRTRISPDGRSLVGVLDIGSSKIACLIAALDRGDEDKGPKTRILGVGYRASRGVRDGGITDVREAGHAIRATIAAAEDMAGATLREVSVSVACGRLASRFFTASTDLEHGIVTDNDIAEVVAAGQRHIETSDRSLVYFDKLGYEVDGASDIPDPEGMAAQQLAIDFHAVTAESPPVRNLMTAVEHSLVSVAGLVAAPYASALACTTEDERADAAIVVDFGGGTTGIAAFADGRFVFTEVFPLGGLRITRAIATAREMSFEDAERIKTLHGTLIEAPSDARERIQGVHLGRGDGAGVVLTKAQLRDIIRPHVARTLAEVSERLARPSLRLPLHARIVLTGGGAELVGMAEFASEILGRAVAVRGPVGDSREDSGGDSLEEMGLPKDRTGPCFSTAVGLLRVMMRDPGDDARPPRRSPVGYLRRVGKWLRNGF